MSYPILYAPTETQFTTNGIGVLSSAVSAPIHRKLNGMDELTLQYPITGVHFSEIKDECIIMAKPDPVTEPQPYRIYRIGPAVGGIITVYARHLAYDALMIPVSPFTASGAVLALEGLKANAAVDCPFEFYTDKAAQGEFSVAVPKSIWDCLGGSEGSILDTFSGEYEFDRYDVRLLNRRGADRGVSIRYGKNLTTLEQDRNCTDCHTGVYPYWADSEGNLVVLPERILHASGTYEREKIRPLDLSLEFETAPTEDQLREMAVSKMDTNQIGVPTVSWKVEFVQLEKTEEYKDKALLERVLLGDTVSVEFPQMNISASARAVETEFDSIREHYNYVYLGSVRASIADTIVEQKKEIEKKPGLSQMQAAVNATAAAILGATGGAVRLLDTDGDGFPDTLYIADNPDPAQAVKVWRFNYAGWGASTNGFNGPFVMGATFDAGIVADFITAGVFDANLIKAGVLQSADGNFRFNLETGEIFIGGYASNDDIASLKSDVDNNAANLAAVRENMAKLSLQSDNLYLQIETLIANGVDKVVTSTGYRFDADGMSVKKDGEEIHSLITHKGVYVDRSGENVLTADANGVEAINVTVKKYLVIGEHTRIEDYVDEDGVEGTALFYLP